ncbi:MAG: thioredoxin family protein [Bacteroidetes bacterium]|nr:thioredoxin family protein [Rhodothermia bacterium]MCS7154607.1 thioredoxin family protein [Bacteroidota bacterium]MCX7906324.1 thioredoxin family protein [Bacteroidota bacterium]MDW8137400.1 thioredoxin family protein [Bacteroidota bacterium]MDW8285646.1 thioredoxin family protein [Bacteroidota bacterium]
MPLLRDQERELVRQELAGLRDPVRLVYFTQELECQYCRETRQLLEEVAALSDAISLEVYNFALDREQAALYGVDKIPATVVMGDSDVGIRLYGIPSGYEFASLLEAIRLLSTGQTGLSEELIERVRRLDQPVDLQVFVTPTCPYCPRAVVTAFRFAYLNPHVRAAMVEAIEFPHLANRYQVYGVPKTVINEVEHVEGAVPEAYLLEAIERALARIQG